MMKYGILPKCAIRRATVVLDLITLQYLAIQYNDNFLNYFVLVYLKLLV